MSVAIKTNPEIWEKLKEKAMRTNKWSARLAQQLTKEYQSIMKAKGQEPYKGSKTKNSLTKWTKQQWQYVDGKKGNRYLPKSVIKKLTPSEKKETNQAKKKGTKMGKQFVANPDSVKKKINKLIKK